MTLKVTLAYPYTDNQGAEHEPDSSPDLPEDEAYRLLENGRARPFEKKQPSTAKQEK